MSNSSKGLNYLFIPYERQTQSGQIFVEPHLTPGQKKGLYLNEISKKSQHFSNLVSPPMKTVLFDKKWCHHTFFGPYLRPCRVEKIGSKNF